MPPPWFVQVNQKGPLSGVPDPRGVARTSRGRGAAFPSAAVGHSNGVIARRRRDPASRPMTQRPSGEICGFSRNWLPFDFAGTVASTRWKARALASLAVLDHVDNRLAIWGTSELSEQRCDTGPSQVRHQDRESRKAATPSPRRAKPPASHEGCRHQGEQENRSRSCIKAGTPEDRPPMASRRGHFPSRSPACPPARFGDLPGRTPPHSRSGRRGQLLLQRSKHRASCYLLGNPLAKLADRGRLLGHSPWPRWPARCEPGERRVAGQHLVGHRSRAHRRRPGA